MRTLMDLIDGGKYFSAMNIEQKHKSLENFLNYKRGNAANGLQLIWIFLIIHQIMRVIHVIIVKREYKPIYLYNAGPKILKGDPDYILNAPLSIIFIFLWIFSARMNSS